MGGKHNKGGNSDKRMNTLPAQFHAFVSMRKCMGEDIQLPGMQDEKRTLELSAVASLLASQLLGK
jgi:hypothetical protein